MPRTWSRIECDSRAPELNAGVEARIADPLWMLARQWQVGELHGEDAATPVMATLTSLSAPLATGSPEPDPRQGDPKGPLPWSLPLETLAEQEAVVEDGPSAPALAGEAGLQWLRSLSQAGFSALRPAFRERYRLALPAGFKELSTSSQDTLRLLHRRSLDARLLAQDMRDKALWANALKELAGDAKDALALTALGQRWLAWYDNRVREPGESGGAWRERRLEHAFSVAARTPLGDAVLSAEAYADGHLDWHAFDLKPEASHGNAPGLPVPLIRRALPTRVRYRGMPALRWWQLEDNQVSLGDLQAEQNDLAKLLIAQFGVVYGDDWYLLPLRLPFRSLSLTALLVHDSMGDPHLIPPAAHVDGPDRVWRFFELDGEQGPGGPVPLSPMLFLPPVLASTLEGPELERVDFIRDEQANMAWGVEERVEDAAGKPVDRGEAWRRSQETPPLSGDAPWRYTLAEAVPPHWVPLLPVQSGGAVLFQRARMPTWSPPKGALRTEGAQGRVLLPDPKRPLFIHEEELPRGGVVVSRSWQLTRGWDGAVHLWVGRRKRLGRGERSSGLEYDRLQDD